MQIHTILTQGLAYTRKPGIQWNKILPVTSHLTLTINGLMPFRFIRGDALICDITNGQVASFINPFFFKYFQ